MLEARTTPDGRATPESLYGQRKRTALLRRRGLGVAHCTVDRLMREAAMNGVRRGRAHRTTIAGKDGVRAGDLLNRDLSTPAPNRVEVEQLTYVRTWAGFVYVSFVVDVFAQRIVGWHAMTTTPAELDLIPSRMAAWSRGQQGHPIIRGDPIAHSDASSPHTALRYTEHLAPRDIAASIGTVGDAHDNSLMETIIGLFKTEAIRPGPFDDGPLKSIGDVAFTTMAWVDWFNHRCLHSTLGMLTPTEAEPAHYAATTALHPEPQPV